MTVDVTMLARRRRAELVAEIERIDGFLDMAAELAGEKTESPQLTRATAVRRAGAPRGVGADTVAACREIVRAHGPQPTRDLLPLVKARDIPVGGKSEIATLSARLSTTGKGVLQMKNGKWHDVQQNEAPGSETTPEREESADDPFGSVRRFALQPNQGG